MDVSVVSKLSEVNADTAIIVPFFEETGLAEVSGLPELGGSRLSRALETGEIRSKLYEMTLLHGDGSSPALLVIGAGKAAELSSLMAMRISAAASRYLTGRSYTRLAYLSRRVLDPFVFAQAVTEGAVRGAYNADLRKTDEKARRKVERITLISESDREDLASGAEVGRIVGEGNNLARDLVNLPPNEIFPRSLAEKGEEIASAQGLEFQALDEEDMRDLGMGSLLGVASGSDEPPRLIVLRYGDRDAPVKLALVGKGLTFDSGGLDLKTAEGMETMKGDMGGAAAVLGGMQAVGRLKPQQISVTAYVGATENMPSGKAMRPGDILRAMNGKTIEVLNTDAEGRLVLADVLAYAVDQGATHIVDFATLTGAASVALGPASALATGKPMEWVGEVVNAADAGLENTWAMPLHPEYRQAMDSEIADLKNTAGSRAGGALNASAFLSEFVDGVPWAHIDIAPTAWSSEQAPYAPKGATGYGVGTIASLVREMSGAKA